MELQNAVQNVFVQLEDVLSQLSDEQYSRPCKSLFGNTIGQHIRHIIELFKCLENGYSEGLVNYEKRKRDKQIETSRTFAELLLQEIVQELDREDKPMILEASYTESENSNIRISTNYYREIAYNLEHTIHHMALIRLGVAEVSNISLPEGFGVASSTIKHRRECAQ